MFFDMHVHFFPDKLAPRAVASLMETARGEAATEGTREDTLRRFKEWGVDGGLALHIATNPKQQENVNNFAKEAQGGRLLSFGSVHPEAETAIAELSRIKDMGLIGIKLHPDYQNFYVEEERVFPIYAECERLGLPIAFHAGWDPISPDDVHCKAEKLRYVAECFPRLRIIAAHMGASHTPEEAKKHLTGLANLWLDTAYMDKFLDTASFEDLVKTFGAEKILFATDCPWSDAPAIVEIIEHSGLSEEEKQRIFYQNAFALLGIREITGAGEIMLD